MIAVGNKLKLLVEVVQENKILKQNEEFEIIAVTEYKVTVANKNNYGHFNEEEIYTYFELMEG